MYVLIDTGAGSAEVCEVDDLQRLQVTVRGALSSPAVGAALGRLGRVEGEHAWLAIDQLRAAGPNRDEWRTRFDAMIDYARSKGWTDDRGGVRVHLEPVAPPSS